MDDQQSIDAREDAFPNRRTSVANRRRFLKTALALGLAVHGVPARADAPGRVLFGFLITPSTEALLVTVMRQLQSRYRPDLGAKPVYIPGNAGTVAMDMVTKAPPDGGTVFMSSSASITLLPNLRKLPVDPVDLLHPVAGVGLITFAFAVGPAVPADVKTMPDYLLWARANPLLATYGVPGRGTASHFVGTEVARMAGIRLKSIAYKGTLPLLDDLAAGSVPAIVTLLPSASDLARYPTIRILALSSGQRWPGYPTVPTLLELNLAEAPTVSSLGFYVVDKTPAARIAELSDAVHLVLPEPIVVAAIATASFQQMPPGDDYRTHIAAERAEWQARIARHDFSADS